MNIPRGLVEVLYTSVCFRHENAVAPVCVRVPMRTLKLSLRRGDLATFAASCIVTSANDSLVGTLQPTYWRFIARHSVDGKLREAAGPELDEACLQIQASHRIGIRRDITRWTGGVKHGASAPVRYTAANPAEAIPAPCLSQKPKPKPSPSPSQAQAQAQPKPKPKPKPTRQPGAMRRRQRSVHASLRPPPRGPRGARSRSRLRVWL